MAEGLLKDLLEKQGRKDIQVLSAGVGTAGGLGPTLETMEVMQAQGIDVSRHVGQPVTPELIRSADLILCMEKFHWDWIIARAPEAGPKVHLLGLFQLEVPIPNADIPDPISRPKEVYESCLMAIEDGIHRVLRWLEKQ